MLKGNILITGGTGFLSRGILRRAQAENWPAQFTVYSRDETKQETCKRKYPGARYMLGDILDLRGLTNACRGIDTIIHAAAIKYVPEAEYNVRECIRINVNGTENVIAAATRTCVETAVLISTDKAVQPVNTYGASKMLCERMWVEAALHNDLRFTFTRYGNVVGSTGSVVPLFQRQLKEDGFVTITDPAMSRFWISIELAVTLVLEASKQHAGIGVIPKAPAMMLGDVARILAGNNIQTVGIRPGEKMHEDLLHSHESPHARIGHVNYYLEPSTFPACNMHPFTYDSNNPSYWIPDWEFESMIEDARCV